MADTTTQKFIDDLITVIWDAEDPESVTNEMVARVFDYLNKGYKDLLTNNSAVQTEKSERVAADAALQRTIDTLQLALQTVTGTANEAKTAAATNRQSIDTILGKNASQAIENFQEIIKFLEGVKDNDSLVALLSVINSRLDTLEEYEAENERLAQKGVNDAAAAQSAAEKAQGSADRLQTAVNSLDDRVDRIINDIDSAGGLAVLDDSGHIKKENLPPGIGDVKEFHSRVKRIRLEDAISLRKATDAGCLLVYDEDSKRFVLAESISDVIDADEWHQATHPLQSGSKYMKTVGNGLQAGVAQHAGISDVSSNWIIANGEVVLNQGNFRYYPVWADQALYGAFSQDGAIPESNKIYICTSDSKGYWWNDGELRGLETGPDGKWQTGIPSIININELCGEPKATGYYTFWTAVEALAAIEADTEVTYRKAGMVITYRVSASEWKTLQLTGELADFGQRAAWAEFGGAGAAPPEGGLLELTDDEGATLNITIPWTSALTEGSGESGGDDSYYGYYYGGAYTYIGEWDEVEPQALDLDSGISAAEATGQDLAAEAAKPEQKGTGDEDPGTRNEEGGSEQ